MKFCHPARRTAPPHRQRHGSKPPRSGGFTLIEVMIVVAIIGILASVALPSYQRHILITNRAHAKACMSEIAQALERRYTTALSYAGNAPALGCMTESGLNSRYNIATNIPAGGTSYTITATPIGAQLKDTECASLTLNNLGATSATGTTPATCW